MPFRALRGFNQIEKARWEAIKAKLVVMPFRALRGFNLLAALLLLPAALQVVMPFRALRGFNPLHTAITVVPQAKGRNALPGIEGIQQEAAALAGRPQQRS